MCGICGFYDPEQSSTTLIREMCDILAHRGPDASTHMHAGYHQLGHRRLSIIDLSTGDQPMSNLEKTVHIIFNGEIYNYRELRDNLENRGFTFGTQSDTEVILRLYEAEGPDAFAKLNGIFAFAILDERGQSQRLVLARDHFGIKPLHYYQKGDLFVFASEQKAILLHPGVPREINRQSLHLHLNLRFTQANETLFKDLHRVPPAHYLIVEDGQVTSLKRYFELEYKIDRNRSESDWIEDIQFHLKQAVQRQLVSDVPIGVYLSGGMDSGSIVSMMHALKAPEINTFTLGFNEPTDEFGDAGATAKMFDSNHRTLAMSLNPMRLMPEVIWHAEEPKINLLQGYLMSQFVSKHVKVVLGGLGGDELFSGYDIHQYIYPFNFLHQAVPGVVEQQVASRLSSLAHRLQSSLGGLASEEYRRGLQMALATGNITKFYLILRNVWDYDRKQWSKIYTPDYLDTLDVEPVHEAFSHLFVKGNGRSALDQTYAAEFHSKMVNDYLLTEDRMSMSHSVEERVPFLDLDLVKLGFTIPAKKKMRLTQTKYLLRTAMHGYLPEQVLRKKKWGFTFNPYLQYEKDLKQTAQSILTRDRIEADGIFNYDFIQKIFDTPAHPRMRWHYNYLWVLAGFYIWKQMYIDSNDFRTKPTSADMD